MKIKISEEKIDEIIHQAYHDGYVAGYNAGCSIVINSTTDYFKYNKGFKMSSGTNLENNECEPL